VANRVLAESYPEVSPTGAPGGDYENIQSSPAMFGGLVAGAEEKAGAGAEQASQNLFNLQNFYNQTSADDSYSKLQDAANKAQFGDPSDPSKPGYYALKGSDAVRAWPDAQAQLRASQQQLGANLNPVAKLQFDENSRRLLSMTFNEMGRHANQQYDVYASATQKSVEDNALRSAGVNYSSDTAYAQAAQDGAAAIGRQVRQQGLGPEALDDAIQQFHTKLVASRVEGWMTKDPVAAGKFLDANQGNVDPQVYDQLKQRLAKPIGEAAGNDTPPAASGGAAPQGVTDPKFIQYNEHLNNGDVQSALRLSEGLRTNAYWDKSPGHPELSHWAIGYGMHQIVREDGTLENVTPFTKITPADAERNLGIQTAKAAQTAQTAIGPSWGGMTPATQSALTSVVYNYGHVPNDIARAASSGDAAALAQAIASHAGDNGGVNSQRRMAEAGAVLGTFGLRGPQATTGPAPSALMPGDQPPPLPGTQAQQETTPAPTNPDIQPAVFTQGQQQDQPQNASVGSMAGPTASPEDYLARKIQAIEERGDLTTDQKAWAVETVKRQYTAAQIASEQDTKAKKAQNDAAANGYMEAIGTGKFDGLIPKIVNDPSMNWETKHVLMDLARRESGEENKASFGPGYSDAYKRILLPSGDPQRISDPIDILKRGAEGGDLTFAGTQKLMTVMKEAEKSVDGYGLQQSKSSLIQYAKSKLSFEQDMGPVKIRDPKGEQLFNAQFVPKFESAYDAWVGAGKNPHEFLTQDNVDKLLKGMRSQSEMASDKVAAVGDAGGEVPNLPQRAPPPPPVDADSAGWNDVMQARPMAASGTPWVPANWAAAVNDLRSDPSPARIAAWDKKFGSVGLTADTILGRLEKKSDTTPNREPEPPPPTILPLPASGFGGL
jgi:GH24 family phage-related lysozyme (muramidase)